VTTTATATAVIPARYDSTRFPGKPLADRTGKPLIQHVVEQVRQAKHISRVVIATDDQRILDAATAFGCDAVMTRSDHPNGTSRIGQVIAQWDRHSHPYPDTVLNVQGDEPEIEPHTIDLLVQALASQPPVSQGGAPMATLASPFDPEEDPADPNIVKLITDQRGHAIYFSRSLIPYARDPDHPKPTYPYLKHPGLYAYRPEFLLKYIQLPPTPLEQAEKLEQLRAIEHGYPIAVVQTTVRHHGIDTPEQYDAFVQRYNTANPS